MTMISDLSRDLVEEIFYRVPIRSLRVVRSTCKPWNDFSKDQSFTKKHLDKAAKEILVIMRRFDSRVCLMSVNLHGIHNPKNIVEPSIKEISKIDQVEIVFHCNGLLLCVTSNNMTKPLLVSNPYLGQVRWIQPRNRFDIFDVYAIEYDHNNDNYKILKLFDYYDHVAKQQIVEYEIYNIKSNSWRVLDINLDYRYRRWCMSLKGNAYFVAEERSNRIEGKFLVCFDFTKERFGPRLNLPVHSRNEDYVILSTVREEQIAVLLQRWYTYEIDIWITTKIEPEAVLWSNFLKVDMEYPPRGFRRYEDGIFFVDKEEKVAVICGDGNNSWILQQSSRDWRGWILQRSGSRRMFFWGIYFVLLCSKFGADTVIYGGFMLKKSP